MSFASEWKRAEKELDGEFMVKRLGINVAPIAGGPYVATHEEGGRYHVGATPQMALRRAIACAKNPGPCTEV